MELSEEWGAATKLFAVRVTTGQEMSTALMIDAKWNRREDLKRSSVTALMVIEEVKSYIFVEAGNASDVGRLVYGFRHVRGRSPGLISYKEVEHFIYPKLAASMLEPGYIVEVTGGPFKGMKGRVESVDKNKNEVRLILLEASFTFPLTISAEYVKIISKGEEGEA